MSPDRRTFLRVAGGAALTPFLGACSAGADRGDAGASADEVGSGGGAAFVYDEAFVIDALAGPIQINIPQQGLPLDESVLSAVRSSGITGVNLTVNALATGELSAYEATNAKMAGWEAELEAHPDTFLQIRSARDLRTAKETGRLGLIFGFQDGAPLEDSPTRLDAFADRGVRIIQLTYNVQNLLGSGSLVPEDTGLTELGRAVVAQMDERRLLVDLSHCGPRTTDEGITASSRPVSITHSGCNAVYRHPRNKDDGTLRTLADRGGVLGIYLMPFLNPTGLPTADHVVRHIEHALDVCGEDHVGIGSDQGIVPLDVGGDFQVAFDRVSAQRAAAGIAAPREDTVPYVPELNHPRRLETIAEMLLARGHTGRVVEKVIGQNFVRLFEEVWGP